MPEPGYKNFGDAFTELILENQEYEVSKAMADSKTECYLLIGSVIYNQTIQEILDSGYTPVFVNCGWRGEALEPKLVARSKFIGCRGPKTRQALLDAGIDVPVTKDSAYSLLPKIKKLSNPGNHSIVIPHIGDPDLWLYNPEELGATEIISPKLKNAGEVQWLIQHIANAKFVLSGAMHACIVAHFYGVPFAPFKTNWVDCPPKWEDWLESIGVPSEKIKFSSTVKAGREWYQDVSSYFC
jgi:hypothetical protein